VDNFDRGDAEEHVGRYAATGGHLGRSGSRPQPVDGAVSISAIVNVMVRKGLCSEAELLQEEHRLRAASRPDDSHYVRIENPEASAWDRPQHPLRKALSKFRWSRRLGTALFGWRWKKLKRGPEEERLH
jgi:hypothetical protein